MCELQPFFISKGSQDSPSLLDLQPLFPLCRAETWKRFTGAGTVGCGFAGERHPHIGGEPWPLLACTCSGPLRAGSRGLRFQPGKRFQKPSVAWSVSLRTHDRQARGVVVGRDLGGTEVGRAVRAGGLGRRCRDEAVRGRRGPGGGPVPRVTVGTGRRRRGEIRKETHHEIASAVSRRRTSVRRSQEVASGV